MKTLTSLLAAAALTALFIAGFTSPVYAVDVLPVCEDARSSASKACQNKAELTGENPLVGPSGLITRGTQIMALITGVASIIMIAIGAFRFVLSNGDANAAVSARKTVVYAIIGLVVAGSAQAIAAFVLARL